MKEIEYPCLMESKNLVVCFSDYKVGHVVEVKTQTTISLLESTEKIGLWVTSNPTSHQRNLCTSI